jgi:hypothetical protein
MVVMCIGFDIISVTLMYLVGVEYRRHTQLSALFLHLHCVDSLARTHIYRYIPMHNPLAHLL